MKKFKEFREEAKPVEKPSKDKATANHPAEDGIEGDVTPPKQGSSEDPKLTHMCALKVLHPKFGEGKPIMGEHAEPDVPEKSGGTKLCLNTESKHVRPTH